MLVVLSGFKIMGKIEMAEAMFLPIFVLKLPVAKAKVPKQKCPREWRVGLKIFGWARWSFGNAMMVSLLFEDAQLKNNECAEEQRSLMKDTRCGSLCLDLCGPCNGLLLSI